MDVHNTCMDVQHNPNRPAAITLRQAKRIAESHGYILAFDSQWQEFRATPKFASWEDARCIHADTLAECLDAVRMDARRMVNADGILRDCANKLRAIAEHPSANDADKALAQVIGELVYL